MEAETHLVLASSSMMTRFLESCSWMRMTFSTPLMMKYPPGSYWMWLYERKCKDNETEDQMMTITLISTI